MTKLILFAQQNFKAGRCFLILTWTRREMTGRREMAGEGGGPVGVIHILVLQEVSLRAICGPRRGWPHPSPALSSPCPPGRC